MFRLNKEKKLSEAQRGEIIGLTKAGISQCKIAEQLDISRATVQRWQARSESEGNVSRKVGCGKRNKKTSAQQDYAILRFTQANPIISAREIAGKQSRFCLSLFRKLGI